MDRLQGPMINRLPNEIGIFQNDEQLDQVMSLFICIVYMFCFQTQYEHGD